jgi:signal transduction histidine kinase
MRVASQVERAGFNLNLQDNTGESAANILVDIDCFIQIVINLVDNAIKFSAGSERRTIDITCTLGTNNFVNLSVRDYGPGIDKDQMKKIFKLFYRP